MKLPDEKRSVTLGTFIISLALVLVVGFVVGTRSGGVISAINRALGTTIDSGARLNVDQAQEVYRVLIDQYDGEIDTAALEEGAARGVADAVGDRYTVFLNPEEASQFDQDLSGSLTGIGAEIGLRFDQPTILRTLDDSPAQKAELQKGDVIAQVDDTVTDGYSAFDVAELIRGEEGTKVSLKLVRDDKPVEVTLTRAAVSDASVAGRMEGSVGVLTIRRFDSDTGELARQQARNLLVQGAESIVLDLRDNGGGYLNQAQSVAGMWLRDKVVVSDRRGGIEFEKLYSTGETVLEDVETIVLINSGSASASEVVAGALKDYDAATIVGEESFGKGTVQRVYDLSGGSKLKVTVAHWYTPKGHNMGEKGIEPDITVELTEKDANSDKDPQLSRALRELK
jgi:carboxyl-terminal processing protease